jgi:hypothetical protein
LRPSSRTVSLPIIAACQSWPEARGGVTESGAVGSSGVLALSGSRERQSLHEDNGSL